MPQKTAVIACSIAKCRMFVRMQSCKNCN